VKMESDLELEELRLKHAAGVGTPTYLALSESGLGSTAATACLPRRLSLCFIPNSIGIG